MYPIYTSEKQLCLDSDVIGSFKTLAPGEHINIPIVFEYRMNMNTDTNDAISKIMSFDVKTSLYKDPITYAFRVTAKKMNTEQDKLNFTSNLSKYNTTYK